MGKRHILPVFLTVTAMAVLTGCDRALIQSPADTNAAAETNQPEVRTEVTQDDAAKQPPAEAATSSTPVKAKQQIV